MGFQLASCQMCVAVCVMETGWRSNGTLNHCLLDLSWSHVQYSNLTIFRGKCEENSPPWREVVLSAKHGAKICQDYQSFIMIGEYSWWIKLPSESSGSCFSKSTDKSGTKWNPSEDSGDHLFSNRCCEVPGIQELRLVPRGHEETQTSWQLECWEILRDTESS